MRITAFLRDRNNLILIKTIFYINEIYIIILI